MLHDSSTSDDHRSSWRMPAEWEPHEATWLAWPHNRSDWPGKFPPIPWVYADIIRHLHTGEKVHLIVEDEAMEKRVRGLLAKVHIDLKQIRFFPIRTDRVWTRDYGPIFVVNGKGDVGCTDWHFNAWAKYNDWHSDDAVPGQIAAILGLPVRQPLSLAGRGEPDLRMVLEGGSIDVNGAGLLLTTEECLLSPIQARNPALKREDLEKVLGEYLGIDQVIWLGDGIAGDDTHGHVDDLARFVTANRVVTVVEDNALDPNHKPTQENLKRVREATIRCERPLTPSPSPLSTGERGASRTSSKLDVVPLPMPAPIFFKGQRLPASYANFYIANEKVLVPTFNDAHDREALGILAEQFPGRQVVGIHALDLVWGLGTLHCMTQQQPRAGTVGQAERTT